MGVTVTILGVMGSAMHAALEAALGGADRAAATAAAVAERRARKAGGTPGVHSASFSRGGTSARSASLSSRDDDADSGSAY